MKRIAFFSHLSEVSGATVALLETVAAFQERGYHTVLVLPGRGPIMERALERNLRIEVIDNPERSFRDGGLWSKVSIALARQRYLANVRRFLQQEKIDLAYINSSTTFFPGIAARLARVPIVWHIHESLSGTDRATSMKKWIIRRCADGLLFASNSGKRLMEPVDVPNLIVPNKVAMDVLQGVRFDRESNSDEAGAGDEVTLMSNGVYPLKGADILFSAVELLQRSKLSKPLRIVIAGSTDADPDFYDLLVGRAEDIKPAVVEFTGLKSSLAPLYAGATLYVSASRNEAMPIAIVEAMAAGVPVVATNVGDCADLLENGLCGWVVPPEDPAALAGAISEALYDPVEAAARATAAAEKIDRLYGREDFWDPLIDFVERVSA